MLISSYIVPHSPILISTIGKNNSAILKKTAESFKAIKSEIIKDKIDLIIIISPHKKNNSDININSHFELKLDFKEFGDYSSRLNIESDIRMSYLLKEAVEPDFYPSLIADHKADYGSAIPLYTLLSENNQKDINIKAKSLIINSSTEKDLNYHFEFGKKISELIESSDKRISLIASAELSHCLNYNAPGGFHQKAILFDEKTIEKIKKGKDNIEEFLSSDNKLAQEAKECGLRPIATLLGIINNREYSPKTLSYQKELGVGYLTMNINIKKNG